MEPPVRLERRARVTRRLKALGRLAAFALVVVGGSILVGRWIRSSMKGADEGVVYLVGHLAQLVILLVFAGVASKLERRPFGDYGMPWRQALRSGFWKGAAAGIL